MERYIKYKRISKEFVLLDRDHQEDFFDDLITEGWEIIYYNETIDKMDINSSELPRLRIVVVVGKKQNNIL